MGKTVKTEKKAAVKTARAQRKITRKMKGALCMGVLTAFSCIVCGCSTADANPLAKSQTQNNEFDHCTIVIAGNASISNGVVVASGDALPTLEILTQTQSLESSGTETYTPTATQTPTTDVKPDLDLNYNGATKTAAGILETLTSASLSTLKSYLTNKTSGTVTLTTTDGQTVEATCSDGSCTINGTTVTSADCASCTTSAN